MKNPIHKIALYIATTLISALSFTIDVADASDKIKKQHSTQENTCRVQDENSNQPIELSTLKARFDRGLD